jgi:6-methylsalicylate decarboxylase
MTNLSISTTIFSLTAPGCTILSGVPAAELARSINQHAAHIRDDSPSRFGFFAALPSLYSDLDAALAEISYALDVLHADGVTLYTRYGPESHYLGHPSFAPVWAELDRRAAVVFIHPTHTADKALVNAALPQPVIDYPHESARAALDLIMSNNLRRFPRCKIILSHAGGTLPYLAIRAAHLLPDYNLSAKSAEEILEEVSMFHYDLALSANKHTLKLLLDLVPAERVLFGTDFPYAPTKTVETNAEMLEDSELDAQTAWKIARGNAERLFPRLKVVGVEGTEGGL